MTLYGLQSRCGDAAMKKVRAMALMMEVACTCDTSVNFYQTTRRRILEDGHFAVEDE